MKNHGVYRPLIGVVCATAVGFGIGHETAGEKSAPENTPAATKPRANGTGPRKPAVEHIKPGDADYTTYTQGARIDEIFNDGRTVYKATVWHCAGKRLIKLTTQLEAITPDPNNIQTVTKSQTDAYTPKNPYCRNKLITPRDFPDKMLPQDDFARPDSITA